MSMRVVPSATTEKICVSPRVNSAEPWARGAMSTSVSIGRISSVARPSGRFLSTAMRLRMMSFSSFAKAALTSASRSRGLLVLGAARARTARRPPPRPRRCASWRSSLASIWVASSSLAPCEPLMDSSSSSSILGSSISIFSLPTLSCSSSKAATSFLISPWAMSRASRISCSVTPTAPASTIRIASSVPATIRSSSSSSWRSSSRVDDEVAVELADPDGAHVLADGDLGDRQSGGGAVHGEDVVGVDVVHRHRRGDQLGLAVPALGEQRAQRAVDHARGQRRLLARSRLAAEEASGNLARGVVALLDVDRQGQEVHVAVVAGCGGAEDHRVAGADDDGSARLLGEFAGLEGDLVAADLRRDAGDFEHAHLVCIPSAARMAASRLRTVVL